MAQNFLFEPLTAGLAGNDARVFAQIYFRTYQGRQTTKYTNGSFAADLNICVKTITRALARLIRRGLIWITGRGKARTIGLTDAGKAAITGELGQGVPVEPGQGVPVDSSTPYNIKKNPINKGAARRKTAVKRETKNGRRPNRSYSTPTTVNGPEADKQAMGRLEREYSAMLATLA